MTASMMLRLPGSFNFLLEFKSCPFPCRAKVFASHSSRYLIHLLRIVLKNSHYRCCRDLRFNKIRNRFYLGLRKRENFANTWATKNSV